jgi:predicted outer membrane repeat protein
LTTVTNLANTGTGSLRDALSKTPAGGTIDFRPGLAGTIHVTGNSLLIVTSVSIVGPTDGSITVSGDDALRIFATNAGTTVSISNLTITHGLSNGANGNLFGNGAGINSAGVLTVSNCTFQNCTATFNGHGGAIFGADTTSLTVTNCTFSNNNAPGNGGAIAVGSVVGQGSTLVVTGCTFTGNAGTGALSQGGAIDAAGRSTITASTFVNNRAPFSGGAIQLDNGSATVTGCTVTGSNNGGINLGLAMKAASTISTTTVANSTGVGISINSQSATIDSCTLSGNGNRGFGGGISFEGNGALTVVNCTVVNNQSSAGGAGLFTFGTVAIRLSTFINNNGGIAGGNLDIATGTTSLSNSIVAGGTAVFGPDIDIGAATFTDLGYNLIGNIRGINNPNTTLSATDLKNVNPFLGPLQNNGGPTATMLPLAGSPAIDAGDPSFTGPPNTDQRGQPRIVNGRVDIGAVEVGPGDNTGGPGTGGPGTGGPGTGGNGGVGSVTVGLAIPRGIQAFATGADNGGPQVLVWNAATKGLLGNFLAYDPSFGGGVRVAVGDVTGDGIPDIVTGPGPGGGPDIRVFSGANGQLVREFMAFSPNFTGGVNVAVGDVNGDGTADIIVAADAGGGPEVKVFSGKDGSVLYDFFAYAPTFTGGVRVAAGDVNGDGYSDIICGAGPGGGPNVTVYSGKDLAQLDNFFAFDPGFTGGVYVGAAQTSAGGKANILVGAGAGGGPNVVVFNGMLQEEMLSFLAYDPAFTGGVRGAGANRNGGSGLDDIVTTPGPGGGADIHTFDGHTGAAVDGFFAINPPYAGGLFVAGAPSV